LSTSFPQASARTVSAHEDGGAVLRRDVRRRPRAVVVGQIGDAVVAPNLQCRSTASTNRSGPVGTPRGVVVPGPDRVVCPLRWGVPRIVDKGVVTLL